MKLKKANKIKGVTTVTHTDDPRLGVVTIHHHQSIKQNANYQSAELGYGLTVSCKDEPEEIRRHIRRVEAIVERAMLPKFKAQGKLLNTISKGR